MCIVRLSAGKGYSQRKVARMLDVLQRWVPPGVTDFFFTFDHRWRYHVWWKHTENGTSGTVFSVMNLASHYLTGGETGACIKPTDGNRCPPVMMLDTIHHGGGVNCFCGMEPPTANASSGYSVIACFPVRCAFLEKTLYMSRTMLFPTQHVTRLLFWNNRMWMSWKS